MKNIRSGLVVLLTLLLLGGCTMVEAARLKVYDQGAYGVLLCGGVLLCFGLPEGTYAQFWE